MSRSGERLSPERVGHAGVDKETAHAVVQGAYDTLCFPVLCRAVWTGQAKGNTMSGKMLMDYSVVKFLAVVGLESDQRQLELRHDISMEGKQTLSHFRFCSQRESPNKVRA